ncbi:MAG: ATP-binding protein [Thermoanaerobaculia bacterium]|nr:ATP-binding protein [Thermoanaerobaculia bacterium]
MKILPSRSVTRAGILAVVAILLAQGLGIWGLLAARRQAVEAAERSLTTQVSLLARRVEAEIASLRGDVAALAQSPPLERFLSRGEDPLVRRWNRLDAGSSLLLFLETHPEVGKISLVGEEEVLLGAMRRGEAVTLFSPDRPPAPEADWRPLRWTLGEDRDLEVEAWLDPRRLLALLVPGLEDRVEFVDRKRELPEPEAGVLRARASPEVFEWSADPRWDLVWTEPRDAPWSLLVSRGGRTTQLVLVQLVLVLLTVVLGGLALWETRRVATLEAERRRQEEIQRLERQLIHSERLASVGRLAAGLAHEINNPLGGAANYLELVREDLESGELARAREGIDRVSQGIDRASGVIQEVLAFSAPGREQEPRGVVDLRPVIERSAAFVRNQARSEEVEIRLVLGDAPLLVEGNSVTLGQLFLNLLLNAVEAQAGDPDRAYVEVRADGEGVATDGDLRLLVEDRGPGIPPEVRDSLFEPFVSTKDSTGLGLAVCRRIVEEHGGTLEGENDPDGGARFRIVFPQFEEGEG